MEKSFMKEMKWMKNSVSKVEYVKWTTCYLCQVKVKFYFISNKSLSMQYKTYVNKCSIN